MRDLAHVVLYLAIFHLNLYTISFASEKPSKYRDLHHILFYFILFYFILFYFILFHNKSKRVEGHLYRSKIHTI